MSLCSTLKIGLVNAHGTATLFNDQMESLAIERAGLGDVPVNALKGYFGHTMGAAGLLETILTMHALERHIIIGTRGYEERGVSGKIHVAAETEATNKTSFIKTISGFGGCNAAVLVEKKCETIGLCSDPTKENVDWQTMHQVKITPGFFSVDERKETFADADKPILTHLYKSSGCNYPKFYKMDGLSKLGFVASLLLAGRQGERPALDDGCAVVLFNRSSSIASDRKYLASIADKDNYFPSPSVFIYTLPNIVTGEIAIHHGLHGETSFYILPQKDPEVQREIVEATLRATGTRQMITGWIDYEDENHFEAELSLIERKDN